MKGLLTYLLERLKEKSTIATLLALIIGAIGINISPESKEAIITAVASIISAVAIVTKERV